VALHRAEAPEGDYHRQYDQGRFLESLEATRRRQATRIVDLLGQLIARPDHILDVGCGRGWFLDTCRRSGMRHVAGADVSPLAVAELNARGGEAHRLEDWGSGGAWPRPLPLSFEPRILTLLDVVEHFPADRLLQMLRGLLETWSRGLEVVVIKTPVSDGFLFRLSRLLARSGIAGPYEQLFQIGTHPPHFHYFSSESLRRLAGAADLECRGAIGDLDFEPETLGDRVNVLSGLPRVVRQVMGRGLGALLGALDRPDSLILALGVRPARTR
jgi:SAM-dependent methyltransferase